MVGGSVPGEEVGWRPLLDDLEEVLAHEAGVVGKAADGEADRDEHVVMGLVSELADEG